MENGQETKDVQELKSALRVIESSITPLPKMQTDLYAAIEKVSYVLNQIEHLDVIKTELATIKTQIALQTADLKKEVHGHTIYRELSEQAITKAEIAVNRRLESMNAFREQLERQARDFATKELVEAIRVTMDNNLKALTAIGTTFMLRDAFELWKKENDGWKAGACAITQVISLEKQMEEIKQQLDKINIRVISIEKDIVPIALNGSRLTILEGLVSNWQGRLAIVTVGWGVILVILNWYLRSQVNN